MGVCQISDSEGEEGEREGVEREGRSKEKSVKKKSKNISGSNSNSNDSINNDNNIKNKEKNGKEKNPRNQSSSSDPLTVHNSDSDSDVVQVFPTQITAPRVRNLKSKVSVNEILHDDRRLDTWEGGVEVVKNGSEKRKSSQIVDIDGEKRKKSSSSVQNGGGGREGSGGGGREGSGGGRGRKKSDSDMQRERESARERECQKWAGKGYDGSSSEDDYGGVVITNCD
jgi:hypothetical protein